MKRVALRLFAERGFEATTVREIGDAAGIMSGSLYYHFESKEAILDAILRDAVEDFLERIESVPSDGDARIMLRGMVRATAGWISERHLENIVIQNEYATVLRQPQFAWLNAATARSIHRWEEALLLVQTQGFLRDDVAIGPMGRILAWSMLTLTRWYKSSGLTIDQAADQYVLLFLVGLTTESGTEREDG